MGLFTYRQVKKARKDINLLRAEQAKQADAQRFDSAIEATRARNQELFQQLPDDAKSEYRAAVAEFHTTMAGFSRWKRAGNGKDVRRAHAELREKTQALLRAHDLIP